LSRPQLWGDVELCDGEDDWTIRILPRAAAPSSTLFTFMARRAIGLRSGRFTLLDCPPAAHRLRSGHQRCGREFSRLVDVCCRGYFSYSMLAAGLRSDRHRSVDGTAASGLFVPGVDRCISLLADALEMSIKVNMYGATR